ncbi:MAG: DUF3592 domain-containing protein [Moraxella sp.]|jgi:hypothetical protein
MNSKKTLLFVCCVLFTFITLVFLLIANFNYHQTYKTYQAIKQQGVETFAYSVKDSCNKGRGVSPSRIYRYEVNSQTYFISAKPEDANIEICTKETLGDRITVYYLPKKPYVKLSKMQLQQGQPSKTSYYFFGVLFSLIFSVYWIGTKYNSYRESQKIP